MCATLPKYVLSPVRITTAFALPLITFVPIKQIVSKSVILSISSIDSSSVFVSFLTASDSPVIEDCPTYKSLDSIIRKSAGIISPAERTTISFRVTSFIGIFFSLPFLITVAVVSTSSFNFSAALLERNTSINSNNVLTIINTAITIILAGLGFSGKIISV